jgi:EmrB/QacA subfamily drug resistance transporter
MPSLSQPSKPVSPRLVLTIVCAGVVLASLDLFIVNVALPQIGRDFRLHGAALGDLSWVLNAYAIVYAALLVLLGRIAERYRRDLGFLIGVGVFVSGSIACSAASGLPQLIAFRVVQATGAALLTPTSLSLVLVTFKPDRRAAAVRTWTAVGGLAATLGPVLGGLLVAASWRWVFLINVPVGLLALVAGWRLLPRVPGHPVQAPEPTGALLVTGGVAVLVLGLVDGGRWGWSSATTLAALGGGAALLISFALLIARQANPLVDRSLFRLRSFTGASVVAVVFSAAFGAMLLSRVLWAQDVWHWSPLVTGLSIAPGPIMVPLVSFTLTGRLSSRLGPGRTIALGSTVFGAGALWWALAAGLRPDYVGEMLGGMLLTGIGVGLSLPTIMATGTASLPPHSVATGSAVVNMFRQIGLAVGVAVLIAVLGDPHSPAAIVDVYRRGSLAVAAMAFAGALLGLALLPASRSPKHRGQLAGELASEEPDRNRQRCDSTPAAGYAGP